MQRNLGRSERFFRALLGIAAVGLVLESPSWGISEVVVFILGSFLLLNAITGRCYLWKILGLNTFKSSNCALDEAQD